MNKKNIFLMFICIFSFCLLCVGYSNIVKELGIQGSVQVFYTYQGVVLDGSLNDSIWTTSVKEKFVSHATEDGSIVMDIYSTRTSSDVFFLVKYYTKSIKTSTSNTWSDYDCVDFRIIEDNNTWMFNLNEKEHFENSSISNRHSFYISTMNGCTTNFSKGFASTPYYNSATGFYEINFEFAKKYSELLKYSDKKAGDSSGNYSSTVNSNTALGFHVATHYNGDEISSFNWGNGYYYDNYKITTTGTELTGNLINESIYQSVSGWNSGVHKISLDGSKSWEIEYKFNNVGNNNNGNNYDYNFVADVYSPSWQNGGWTIRSDWYGWGSWTFGSNETAVDGTYGSNATFNAPTSEWTSNFVNLSKNMDVVLNVNFNASSGYMLISLTYHSNSASASDVTITYSCSNISWRGKMIVELGAMNADITINSLYLKSGSVVEKTDNHSRLAGKMIEYNSNISSYNNTIFAYSNYSAALYKNLSISSNGTFSVDISTKDNTSAGLIFGYSNYSCYRMYMNKDKKLIIDKVQNGIATTLATVDVPGYSTNTTYTYKVDVRSDGTYCYFNGALRTIVNLQLTGTGVGVFGSRGASFKNFSAT